MKNKQIVQPKSRRSVLRMTNSEARKFFLKNESYHDFILPSYFKFEPLLSEISRKIEGKNLFGFCHEQKMVRECEKVNHILFDNKDGKYAWRPMTLIHPAIYASLVNVITEEKAWAHIQETFKKYQCSKINCFSIPVEEFPEDGKHKTTRRKDKAEQISQWLERIEKKSIELSLDYQYLIETDITNCYPSIYTHSIAWALHGKETAKGERRNENLIGNVIDWHIQDMNLGQTNGIPQGSVLMHFVAEMVLAYADTLLVQSLTELEKTFLLKEGAYHILRYRDDYRIFSKNPQIGEEIVKRLGETLMDLGLKLNPMKTKNTDKLISNAQKPEKRYWITQKQAAKDIREYLILIHEFADRYPNSGGLLPALKQLFHKCIPSCYQKEDFFVLIAIITDIAYRNPRTYPWCCAIISKVLQFVDDDDQKRIIEKIHKKFQSLPNTNHLNIWLQRISVPIGQSIPFDAELCKAVSGQKVRIWNSDWLKGDIKKRIDEFDPVDRKKLANLSPVVSKHEVDLFAISYGSGA